MLIQNPECAQNIPVGYVGICTLVSISAFTSHRTGSSSQQIRVNLGVNSAASYLEFSTVDPNLATRHLRICAIEKGGCRTSTNEKFKRYTGKKHLLLFKLGL